MFLRALQCPSASSSRTTNAEVFIVERLFEYFTPARKISNRNLKVMDGIQEDVQRTFIVNLSNDSRDKKM